MRNFKLVSAALAAALFAVFLWLAPSAETDAAPACGGRDLVAAMKETAPEAYAALKAEADKIANGEGLLWRVEKEGVKPSYVFGTIHITDSRITDLPAPVEAALEEADTVAVESADALDPQKMANEIGKLQDLMNFTDGGTLVSHLSDERRAELTAALRTLGADIEIFGATKPWVVATALAIPPCEMARQLELDVVDKIVAETGKAAGASVVSLETVAEQLSAFDRIPLDAQAEFLISSVRIYPQLQDFFATMAELYLRRRIALIEALTDQLGEQTGVSEQGYAAFNDSLIDSRNKLMADRAAPLIDKGAAFIAVGALHLIGDNGLVALLRDKGYKVTRVY